MKRFLSILVCCAMLIGLMGPISTAAATASTTTHTTDIAVMGYNALNQPGVIENWAEYYTYNTRIERTVDIISRYDADSIGFQEVNYNIRNALNVMLKDYTMAPNMEMSSNAIFYRTDRMEVLESGVFWLSETPDYPSKYEDASEERTATYAVLRNKVTGVTYIHFNTHLDHISQTAVSYGMRVLRERIEAMRVKYPGIGIVATGDFNMTRTHEAYDIMTSKWVHVDMQDSLFCAPVDQVYNEGATMINGYLTIEEDLSKYDGTLAIDHLFASIDELDVVSYKVMREGDKDNPQIAASDHFGVYVELNLGQGSVKRQPTETEILAAYGTAEIDGVMDDAYAASNGGVTKNLITYYDLLEDDQITSANYTYLYDENYLYYYIDVKDAVVTDAAKHTHDHTSDGLEIYYNFAKSTTKPTDYGAASGEAGYFRVYSDGYVASNVSGEYTAVLTETGYVIEGKIPLTESAKTLITSGERVEIGASFTISDDADNGANGERDYLLGTHDDVLAAWGNPNTNMSVYLLPNANARRTAPYGEVVVDGEMDISYTGAFGTINTEVLCDGGNAIPEIDRTSARWWATHDQDNLYYYIEVTDAHVTDADIAYFNDSNGAKAVDCVEIYYNYAKGSTNPTSYGAANGEAGYFTVFANGKDFVGADSCSNYVAKHTETGYVIEGSIPMTTALKELLNGDSAAQIGLSFLIHDDTDNGAGGRDYLAWNDGDVLSAWSDPSKTAALYLDPTPETFSMAPYGAVELDGELDAAYADATAGTVDNCIIGPLFSDQVDLPDSEKTSMKYYAAHDRNYLYLYLDVTDYHVTDADIANFYDSNGAKAVDGIEIYYNYAKGTTNPTSWGGDSGYFTVFANGVDLVGGDAVALGSTYVAKHTDTGYVIEIAMPLTTDARIQLDAGNLTIGLAFVIHDDANNGVGGRDYVIVHDVDGGNSLASWSAPTYTSDVVLVKNQVSGQIATTGTVVVDGEKDHVFDLSTTGKIDNVIIKYNELLDESQETTATYSFARDDEYLYYYIDVTDYAVTPADIADFVDDNGGHAVDCIEIYYNFVRGTNSASNWGAVTGEAGYFTMFANGTDYIGGDSCSTYAAKHTDTGYVIEGRIPLSDSVKATLQAGENVNIGVAFQISDDADNGAVIGLYGRDYLIVSNSDVLSAWSNPASINTMILLEGDATAMPEPNQGGDDGEDAPEPVKTEFTVTLPDVEGLTITTDKETYKEGETVTLDIQLDEGYEFVQDAGLYDFGHWSNSSQRWKYFVSCVHGWYMMGRSLKADGQILIWSGNTFVMPDHDVEIIAEVEKIDTAVAQKNSVTLDGVKDEVYENSTAVEVNRLNESKTYFSAENPAHAYGTVTATYDNNYLYIFGEVTDPTKTTVEMVTNDVSSTTDLSLHGMDGITFYFDFLNTDTENVASNEYGFVEGESGLFVIDSLGLKTGNSGAVYNKLGAGFAAYNGDTDKADYVVVGTDTGYNVELKIALSDSVKAKLAAANAGDEIKIGFGAMILDDTHNNGGFDYENGDALICNSSLVANLWQATIFAHDAQGNLQVNCYASPRWMSTMTLVASETEECEHSWTSEVKEATCTEDGSVTYTCEHCGETYAETIEATGHSYVSEVKEATCTENGSVTYTCEHCGATYTETIEATGHNYENGTCTNCGAEKPSGEGDPADTGDAFSAMWILLLLVSMAGAAAMVLNRKKFVK